jgi:pyruvate/2-oxoglutarate dehydrogenase complex dihydrolipoamide acyltransferase (E2) component
MRKYADVNLGFAVDTPRGLLVPVIQRANLLSLEDLMAEVRRLTENARLGTMRPEDMQRTALTVSNLGMYGIRMGTPVINEGESILVFVGVIEERVVVRSGTILALPQLTLSIAFDHRLADGVTAAKFSRDLKLKLESTVTE